MVDEKEAPTLSDMERLSYNGLLAMTGQIEEECNRDLTWPRCIITYKAMLKDSTVSSTLNLMEMQITKVPWRVKIPSGYEEELKDKAEFLESCMNDMTHSWTEFIRQASSFNRYGFAPVEKVYRQRRHDDGSRYDDGLYGIRELPLITQDSVSGWDWDNKGRNLSGLFQIRNIPTGMRDRTMTETINDDIRVRREKFLLFRADAEKDSPIGQSPLNSVYMSWRYKTELKLFQAHTREI